MQDSEIFQLKAEIEHLKKLLSQKEKELQEKTSELQAAYQQLTQSAEDLRVTYMNASVLSKIGQELTSSLDFEQIFERLYNQINFIMDAAIFGVFIYNSAEQTIEASFLLENAVRLRPTTISMNEEKLVVWCIKNRKEIIIGDSDSEFHLYIPKLQLIAGEKPYSVLYFPMIFEDEIIGAITTQSFRKHAYTSYHIDIMQTVASYTAIALYNARSYNEVKKSHEEINQQRVQLAKAFAEIQQQKEEITDSIRYAKRIQEALLPSIEDIKQAFPQSFIFYQSRDIVSGDFYWFTKKQHKNIIAAVDCTGHGVPGAFMAVLGSSLLDEIILEKNIEEPDQILEEINISLQQRLKQLSPSTATQDGMDIALLIYDESKGILKYAGANNPLYWIRGSDLFEVQGDRLAVGGGEFFGKNRKFSAVSLEVKPGDLYYIFTDGYADQFGGEKDEKFKYKRLKQLLLSIRHEPMDRQMELLRKTHIEWKGEREQTDDILIIGLKF
ncbi:MAG: SpoIIE family protein phosphatase [Bacteroidia bacterium]|nr:SpoIIE family protein phosphatase [Bacteroidia bacterium]MDW8158948.1 SpoIIE family protein phosphatase [Bacteroidia bacterium]